MENTAFYFYEIFTRAIHDYHIFDDADRSAVNPYPPGSIEWLAYEKNWIDTVQWHLEDMIRVPDIDSSYALAIKRRIDDLNQRRTDAVEMIDDYFQMRYGQVRHEENARHNTESLGWAIDRLSILCLKEFHVDAELRRTDALPGHLEKCISRRGVLTRQKQDLIAAINWLIDDVEKGKKINKVYRQLKMYNDEAFNPALYSRAANMVNNQ